MGSKSTIVKQPSPVIIKCRQLCTQFMNTFHMIFLMRCSSVVEDGQDIILVVGLMDSDMSDEANASVESFLTGETKMSMWVCC